MKKCDYDSMTFRAGLRLASLRGIDQQFEAKRAELAAFVQWEIDRAVRKARKEERAKANACRDCGASVIPEPVLCNGCHEQRNVEGVSTDDFRTIKQWRKT